MRHRGWLADLAADAVDSRARLLVLAASATDIREAAEVIKGIEASSRTLKTIIDGQRKAHGIDDERQASDNDYEEI